MAQGDTLGVVMQSDIGSGASGGVAAQAQISGVFSATATYAIGAYVVNNGLLYRCTTAHSGAWDAAHFEQVTIGGEVQTLNIANSPSYPAQVSGNVYLSPPLYQYEGKDLTVAFASEIAGYSDVWAWLKARLTAGNLAGLFIKDYIPMICTNNYTVICQIADIDHDLHFMDTEITKHHIDFISKDLWNDYHVWNKVNYNNGIAATPCPWLASDLKAWLNSESGDVPNATTADPATVAVDYSTTGVYDKLPQTLKNVIVERRNWEPNRYTAGSLLTDDASATWLNIGKLWVPNEVEVYNSVVWGTRNGYNFGTSHIFPIFLDGKTRIKGKGNGGSRASWWLRSARSGNSTNAARVNLYGHASHANASDTSVGVPVCFRIAA